MKTRITKTGIKNIYGNRIYRLPYNFINIIDKYINLHPRFYNSGVYGWNYDLVEVEVNGYKVALVYGYRVDIGKKSDTLNNKASDNNTTIEEIIEVLEALEAVD